MMAMKICPECEEPFQRTTRAETCPPCYEKLAPVRAEKNRRRARAVSEGRTEERLLVKARNEGRDASDDSGSCVVAGLENAQDFKAACWPELGRV